MKTVAKIAVSAVIASIVLTAVAVAWLVWPEKLPEPAPNQSAYIAALPPPRPEPPDLPPDLQRRVFVDANATPAGQVLTKLARAIPATLKLDPQVKQPVSVRVSNVTARTALDAICESIGCRWAMTGDSLVVTAASPPPPIPEGQLIEQKLRTSILGDLSFNRTPFRDAIAAISRRTRIAFTVENVDPETPVTVDVSGDQPSRAIEKIIRAAGWGPGGSGSVALQGNTLHITLRPEKGGGRPK